MILRPTHAVLGVTDVDRATRLLGAFGFGVSRRRHLDAEVTAALYGLDGPTEEVTLTAGAARGWLRLVHTPHPAIEAGPFALGPHALDLYGRDIQRSVACARDAGAHCGPVGRYRLGPLAVEEIQVVGPDHLVLVIIAVDRRRPSLLDEDPARWHSEVHAAVWTVADIDAVLPFWRDEAGLQVLLDVTTSEPAISTFMELPRPDTRIRLAVMADAATAGAPRFELIAFPDDPGDAVASWPLRAGLHALGCEVDDLDAVCGQLTRVIWGRPVRIGEEVVAVSGEAPGGVRIEVHGGACRDVARR